MRALTLFLMFSSTRSRHTSRSVQSFSSSVVEKPASKATKPPTLAKRLLFPTLPAEADLPPLLASPDVPSELNAELYDFIAIALRAYVHPWWTKVTRYDREFLPAITSVLVVVIRVLEARLVKTDLAPLVLQDIPSLLEQHILDYRNARSKLHTAYATGGAATLPQLFHHLQPHMAVSPDGRVDEAYVRQAVDDVLKTCLPDEDYGPDTERYIIREVVVGVLAGGILPKVAQPWFIHQTILGLLGSDAEAGKELEETLDVPSNSQRSPSSSPARPPLQRSSSSPISLNSVAILFLSTIQSLSGICLTILHAYRNTVSTIKKVNAIQSEVERGRNEEMISKRGNTLPGGLMPMTPFPPLTPAAASGPEVEAQGPPSPPPSPLPIAPSLSRISSTSTAAQTHFQPSPNETQVTHQQVQEDYVYPSLSLLSALLSPPPSHSSSRVLPLALTHVLTLILTPFTPLLSRVLPYLLYTHILSYESLAHMIRSAKGVLFPSGWPAVSPPDPGLEEQAEIRRALERRLLDAIPRPLTSLFGPTPAARAHLINELLAPFDSAECNTHLIVLTLDLVLLKLFPEMGVKMEPDVSIGTPMGSTYSLSSLAPSNLGLGSLS